MPPALLLAYAALLIYGSLYPFVGWSPELWPRAIQGLLHWPVWRPRSDMITNLLVYIPLGMMLAAVLPRRYTAWRRALLAVLLAAGLSLSMELLQALLPGRVSSLRDLFWNTLGAALGVLLYGACCQGQPLRKGMNHLRLHWLHDDRLTSVGLAVLGLWLLAQWMPFSIDFNPQRLNTELQRFVGQLRAPAVIALRGLLVETLEFLAVALLWTAMIRPQRSVIRSFALLAATTLFMQWLLIDQRLTAEFALGLLLALPLAVVLRARPATWAPVAIVALIAAFVIEGTSSRFPWGVLHHPFNWFPFIGNIGRLSGLSGLIESLWLFANLAFWSLYLSQAASDAVRRVGFVTGLLLVLLLSFAIEWIQTGFPDRWPDVTDPLLAVCGWLLMHWYYQSLHSCPSLSANA